MQDGHPEESHGCTYVNAGRGEEEGQAGGMDSWRAIMSSVEQAPGRFFFPGVVQLVLLFPSLFPLRLHGTRPHASHDGHPDFVNGSHLRGVTKSLGHLLFTCRSGTAQHSRAASGSGSGSCWPTAQQQTPVFSPPLSLISWLCGNGRKGSRRGTHPSHPTSDRIPHPPSPPPHLRSYPRERLGTGNKTEHDAELEGRIEMGMGINHVWSTGSHGSTDSHASRAEEARAEEARAE